MPINPRESINNIRERCERREEMAPEDADAILEASNQMDLLGHSEYSDKRHRFYLMRWATLATEVEGLADVVTDRDAAERVVRHINREYDNPETNKDYRVAVRNFGKIVAGTDEPPESVSWIPGGYPSNYDPAPDPSDMLRWDEEIQPMLRACRNARDEALIALAWDLGPRPYELYDLSVGSVTDHKYGLQITVDGKRGRRSPVLVPSTTYLNRWLERHPGDDSSALWTKLNSDEKISRRMLKKALDEAAERAGVTRPVTPSNFRKSSASHLASQNVNQAHLEDHHGWSRGSEVAARYISVFGEQNDREIARAHGVDVGADEPDPTAPIRCYRCSRETPRERDLCMWCGAATSQKAVEKAREKRSDRVDAAVETSGSKAESVAKLDEFLDENPDIESLLLDD